MTIEQKRERLRALKEIPQPRSPALEAELAALVEDLHGVEARNLAVSTQRMRDERVAIGARRATLEHLEARRAALLARLESALADGRRESDDIDGELAMAFSQDSAAVRE